MKPHNVWNLVNQVSLCMSVNLCLSPVDLDCEVHPGNRKLPNWFARQDATGNNRCVPNGEHINGLNEENKTDKQAADKCEDGFGWCNHNWPKYTAVFGKFHNYHIDGAPPVDYFPVCLNELPAR